MTTARIRLAVVLIGATLLVVPGCGRNSPSAPSFVSFQGQYTGTYVISACTDDGGLYVVALCAAIAADINSPRAVPIAITLSLTQDNDVVTGRVTLGATAGALHGSVSTAGTLSATAVMNPNVVCCLGEGVTVTETSNITSWNTTLSGNSMAGTFTLVDRYATTMDIGTATLNARISSLTR